MCNHICGVLLRIEKAAMQGFNRPEAVTPTMVDCWWDKPSDGKFNPKELLDLATTLHTKAKYITSDISMC